MPLPIFLSRKDVDATTSLARPLPPPEAPSGDSRPGRSTRFLRFPDTGRQQARESAKRHDENSCRQTSLFHTSCILPGYGSLPACDRKVVRRTYDADSDQCIPIRRNTPGPGDSTKVSSRHLQPIRMPNSSSAPSIWIPNDEPMTRRTRTSWLVICASSMRIPK